MTKKLLALDDRGSAPQQLMIGAGLTVVGHTISAEGGEDQTAAIAEALAAGKLEHVEMAYSDQSSTIEAGTGKIKKRIRFAGTLIAVYAELETAHSSGLHTVDINKNGTTVLSTKLTIDANERDSATAATPAVISVSSWAANDEISIDVDVAGGGTPIGGKVTLVFARA